MSQKPIDRVVAILKEYGVTRDNYNHMAARLIIETLPGSFLYWEEILIDNEDLIYSQL